MSTNDSLILADVIELLGGGVVSSHPLAAGARIVLTAPGADRGSPQPVTEYVASLLLDGERPTGRRASNRTIVLPVTIWGTSRTNINGARELIQQLVDQQNWQLKWTPDPGTGTSLPLVFDCFRATAVVETDLDLEDELVSRLVLTFQALPYGRSDTTTTLVFPSPSVAWPPPPNPAPLDDFSSVSTSTQVPLWSQSAVHLSDSNSAHWDWSVSDGLSPAFYTHTMGAAVDITGLTKLAFNFGMGSENYTTWHNGPMTFALTLTDNAAHTLTFGGSAPVTASGDVNNPRWNPVAFAIPVSASFVYTNVSSYSIKAWRKTNRSGALILDGDVYLNGLAAIPSATSPIAASRGNVYRMGDPGGTARAPMSAQFQSQPLTTATTQTFSTAGDYTFAVPANVTTLGVQVKGATGKGGDRTSSGAGGGAGGGAGVFHATYPVSPGSILSLHVGAAGGAGGFPTLAASYWVHQDGWNTSTLVTPSFTPAAGELLVLKAVNSDRSQTYGTPTGGGLTWTNQVDQNVTGHTRNDIWTATVGGSPSAMTVTLTVATSQQNHAILLERWQNAKIAGSPAVANATGSGAPSTVITTVANNSVISWTCGDYDQGTGARTYRGSPVEEQYWLAGDVTGYVAYQTQATAGAVTIGLTAPSQTWTIAAIEIQAFNTGALVDGGNSTFDNSAFIAAGGKSVPVNTATGGAGGLTTASTAPAGGTKLAGGNGFTASTTGGGAGSSAGDALAGVNAASQTGATAPSGGISGGSGGNAGGNNGGSVPGGGAFSTGGSASGAAGSDGKIVVSYTPPLKAFKTLAVHSPGYGSPDTLNPLIPAGSGVDPPDAREYTIASPVAGLNARFSGTYTVVAMASSLNSTSSSRTLTVGVNQYDYPGATVATTTVSRTFTPTTESPVIPSTNAVIVAGEITLPVRDIAADQTAAFFTVTVLDTNASDRYLDILMLDVTGQTAVLAVASGSGHYNYYLDEPDITRDWGRVLASDFGRESASSALDSVIALSGGPLVIDPAGPGWLLVYSPDAGAPALTAYFYPRWRDSRLT